ncbi:MAG: triose-phosphate isomerase [Microthrixaceae bacterium]
MANARKPFISGNWKMNHNHLDAVQFIQKLYYRLEKDDYEAVEISIHSPFTDIRSLQTIIESDKMKFHIGAQNCHYEPSGAFTGEVSAPMLAKLSVSHVIIGHSERREYFGETDEIVNKKLKAVLGNGMTPILCCGETLEERESGEANSKVEGQIRAGLAGITKEHVASMVIAYEPIWAIGTGATATSADAEEMCLHIRGVVAGVAGNDAAESVRIQYGGSVKPGNIAELMAQPNIDGALVGGASLEADEFAALIQYRNHGR